MHLKTCINYSSKTYINSAGYINSASQAPPQSLHVRKRKYEESDMRRSCTQELVIAFAFLRATTTTIQPISLRNTPPLARTRRSSLNNNFNLLISGGRQRAAYRIRSRTSPFLFPDFRTFSRFPPLISNSSIPLYFSSLHYSPSIEWVGPRETELEARLDLQAAGAG